MSRYARQIALPEIGHEGQARIEGARVLVVGAGGLGVPVLQYLAGAGVGRITLVDPDVVEETNLHRQPLYRMGDIGLPKVQAAAAALGALNPAVAVATHVTALDPANAPALLERCDVALDCADSFAVSYALSDACMAAGVPLISASALGRAGYAGGFCGPAPSLRAVFPDLPERAATCATAGVMGSLVGMIGALQAQMALSVLLGHDPAPLGQLVTIDAATWRMGGFRFDGAPEPDAAESLPFVAQSQLAPGDLVIDLRDEDEAPTPAAPHARRLQVEEADTLRPAPGQRVVFCCRTGLRAFRAARALQTHWQGPVALAAITPPEISYPTPEET
ncbi:HesA/MoeB/ThiF family protein [Alkalilacustris brevis]|uniref:HesA/MoeB/ThiF family protein n=1 Tax=Alkalilacustris brevis TaxID=2026338 RepID=UPI00192E310D|nr:HesA/MoeB/ThiF family protein [Alkalilacustris brevis]